jgi:hypothetical protein
MRKIILLQNVISLSWMRFNAKIGINFDNLIQKLNFGRKETYTLNLKVIEGH